MSCGAEYIGQTGLCANDRLREHHREVEDAAPHSQHPIDAQTREYGGCESDLAATTALRVGRKIIQAFRNVTSPQIINTSSLLVRKSSGPRLLN
ncbi:uncharacterized protein LOC121838137 [Ixodes scapularis]|uniref:uncharacterized protein LOC121838137 n=1 Tax=Ixodes scapularis TaxID=6945 RepID=UPI001C3868B0|nr:uncharacterized protein LOC121838137 [Ixodes scapularis]